MSVRTTEAVKPTAFPAVIALQVCLHASAPLPSRHPPLPAPSDPGAAATSSTPATRTPSAARRSSAAAGIALRALAAVRGTAGEALLTLSYRHWATEALAVEELAWYADTHSNVAALEFEKWGFCAAIYGHSNVGGQHMLADTGSSTTSRYRCSRRALCCRSALVTAIRHGGMQCVRFLCWAWPCVWRRCCWFARGRHGGGGREQLPLGRRAGWLMRAVVLRVLRAGSTGPWVGKAAMARAPRAGQGQDRGSRACKWQEYA